MEKTVPSHILYEMMTYYNERAPEYDEWFYRKGRYDMGPEMNAQWFVEIDEVSTAFKRCNLQGAVLEIASGTGIWTEQLLQTATSITAIDASAEMIAINRAKTKSARVLYVQADLFTWSPGHTYDAIFFGFWISHVPYEQLPRF